MTITPKEKYSKFLYLIFLLTAFSVSIIVRGPFLTVVVGRFKKSCAQKSEVFFARTFCPDQGNQNRHLSKTEILSFFYFYPFHSYQVASIIIFTDVGAYNSQKPTWPRFCSKSQSSLASSSSNFFDKHHKNFLSLREPNPSHILTHQKSPSHRSR